LLKRIISKPQQTVQPDRKWLKIDEIAEVEITSEEETYPIEGALIQGLESGWRASEPGPQTIRLIFNQPQPLSYIYLSFVEAHVDRTQEYSLSWSPDGGKSFQEIVRQQWNFSTTGSTLEIEEHQVDLFGVTMLELKINPDISGGMVVASLKQLRLK
jgi:hypothetical protein